MEIGFNNQWPIVATALNSMEHDNRYPIIHVVMRHRDNDDATRKYYYEFETLSRENESHAVESFKQALMIFLAENSNLKLPYLIDGKYYRFSNNALIPGHTYSLLPDTL